MDYCVKFKRKKNDIPDFFRERFSDDILFCEESKSRLNRWLLEEKKRWKSNDLNRDFVDPKQLNEVISKMPELMKKPSFGKRSNREYRYNFKKHQWDLNPPLKSHKEE